MTTTDGAPTDPMQTEAIYASGCRAMTILVLALLALTTAVGWLLIEAAWRIGTWIGGSLL